MGQALKPDSGQGPMAEMQAREPTETAERRASFEGDAEQRGANAQQAEYQSEDQGA